MGVEGVWAIERLRRRASKLPLIAYTAYSQSEWEEEAFLHGVTHVLTKPVRARLLNSLLERLWNVPTAQQRMPQPPMPVQPQLFRMPESAASGVNAAQTLDMRSEERR